MPAPAGLPNLDRILRAVEQSLKSVNAANDYRTTNGFVVDRGRDPTAVIQDFTALFDERNVAAAVGVPNEVVDPKRTGGVRRYQVHFAVMTIIRLSNDDRTAGITLDSLVAAVVDDIKTAMEGPKIVAAAQVLATATPSDWPSVNSTGSVLSCIDPHVIAVNSDSGLRWPLCQTDVIVQCEYDRPLR